MARTLSGPAFDAIFRSQTDKVFVFLLTIEADGTPTPIRVTSDSIETISGDELYIPFRFEIGLYTEDENTPAQVALRISAVDQTVVEAVRGTVSAPTCRIQQVLASTPDVIEVQYIPMKMRMVSYDSTAITATLSIARGTDQAMPGYRFTPDIFAGLFA